MEGGRCIMDINRQEINKGKLNMFGNRILTIREMGTGNFQFHKTTRIKKILPGAKKIILMNAGHCMNMDQPEELNRIILEFLTSQKL
jgi:hypothetical protein